jgi:hypothetical protein
MTHSSIATPTATKKVNTHTECSQGTDELSRVLTSLSKADMVLSSAEMELSKAEASVGRLEALWIKHAKITIGLLLAASVSGKGCQPCGFQRALLPKNRSPLPISKTDLCYSFCGENRKR